MALIDNIVFYYKLDDATGSTATDSTGTFNATWNGTLGSQWGTGKINGDGVFNGTNNYILTPATGDYNVRGNLGFLSSEPFTLQVWYKGTDTRTNSVFGTTLSLGLIGWASNNVFGQLGMSGGIPEWTHYNGGWLHEAATTNIADGSWHHVVFVNNSNLGNLYVDGNLENSGFSSTLALSSGTYFQPYHIGAAATPVYTSGQFDEVGMWSRSLSGAEVTALYNSGAGFQYPFISSGVVSSGFFAFM